MLARRGFTLLARLPRRLPAAPVAAVNKWVVAQQPVRMFCQGGNNVRAACCEAPRALRARRAKGGGKGARPADRLRAV